MYHLTCLMHVPYLGKLEDPKNHEFSLKVQISQCWEVKCETVINSKILIMLNKLILLLIMQVRFKKNRNKFYCRQHFSAHRAVWNSLHQNVIDAAISEWRKRLRVCVHADGQHFEHLLWCGCTYNKHLRRYVKPPFSGIFTR